MPTFETEWRQKRINRTTKSKWESEGRLVFPMRDWIHSVSHITLDGINSLQKRTKTMKKKCSTWVLMNKLPWPCQKNILQLHERRLLWIDPFVEVIAMRNHSNTTAINNIIVKWNFNKIKYRCNKKRDARCSTRKENKFYWTLSNSVCARHLQIVNFIPPFTLNSLMWH